MWLTTVFYMTKSKGKKLLRTLGKKAGVSQYDWEKNVDMSDPDSVKAYLNENMSEGYLSDEEEAFIEELVEIYGSLLDAEEKFDKILNRIQLNKVD